LSNITPPDHSSNVTVTPTDHVVIADRMDIQVISSNASINVLHTTTHVPNVAAYIIMRVSAANVIVLIIIISNHNMKA
jgi:hypothetical protein